MKLATHRFALRRLLCRTLATRQHLSLKTKSIIGFSLFLVSFSVKSLQAVDLEPTIHTAEQPGAEMSSDFDERALAIVAGQGILMPEISDPSDTSLLANAPGYPIFLSAVYAVSGRSYFTVQAIQNAINSISPVLMFLIAGNLISWRVGIASGVLSGVSHHLSYYSNLVLSDSLCPLPILVAVYVLVRIGFRSRASLWPYALAGSMIGLSAWIRPNPMLMGLAFIVLMGIVAGWQRRVILNGIVLASASFLTIAPITIRNYLLYGEFVPIRIGVGIVLWEGLGDASGGRFGALTDEEVIVDEVARYNNLDYGESWASPDGIKRDRDRVRRSLEIIAAHPVWYLGSIVERMAEMLKGSAHAPLVFRSTDTKLLESLSRERSAKPIRRKPDKLDDPQIETIDRSALRFGRSISWLRPPARALQRITKETGLPFIITGLVILFIASRRRAFVILFVPVYYLLFQSVMHTEFRYTLAMRYFLLVLAAIVWTLLFSTAMTLLQRGAGRIWIRREAGRTN
jgi:dolichyl-phosphate-mannose-protein mannosyltransferase